MPKSTEPLEGQQPLFTDDLERRETLREAQLIDPAGRHSITEIPEPHNRAEARDRRELREQPIETTVEVVDPDTGEVTQRPAVVGSPGQGFSVVQRRRRRAMKEDFTMLAQTSLTRELPQLVSPLAVVIFFRLLTDAEYGATVNVSVSGLARDLGRKRTSVRAALAELEAHDYARKRYQPPGKPAVWQLHPDITWRGDGARREEALKSWYREAEQRARAREDDAFEQVVAGLR